MNNVITLGKLIGLLLFCLSSFLLMCLLIINNIRNELACLVMGTIFLVTYVHKRAGLCNRSRCWYIYVCVYKNGSRDLI